MTWGRGPEAQLSGPSTVGGAHLSLFCSFLPDQPCRSRLTTGRQGLGFPEHGTRSRHRRSSPSALLGRWFWRCIRPLLCPACPSCPRRSPGRQALPTTFPWRQCGHRLCFLPNQCRTEGKGRPPRRAGRFTHGPPPSAFCADRAQSPRPGPQTPCALASATSPWETPSALPTRVGKEEPRPRAVRRAPPGSDCRARSAQPRKACAGVSVCRHTPVPSTLSRFEESKQGTQTRALPPQFSEVRRFRARGCPLDSRGPPPTLPDRSPPGHLGQGRHSTCLFKWDKAGRCYSGGSETQLW